MKNTVLQTNWNFIISKIPNQSCSHELNSVTKIFVIFVIAEKGSNLPSKPPLIHVRDQDATPAPARHMSET